MSGTSEVSAIARTGATAQRVTTASKTAALPEGHMWQRCSPFRDKTAFELHEMFLKKGFQERGKDPMNGLGSYINPKNGRQYRIDPNRIDPKNVGRYVEPNHVDVSRLDQYQDILPKKRFGYADD